MRKKFLGSIALLSALLICWACGNKGATAISNQQSNSQSAAGDLRFKAPDGWTTEKSSPSMRVAQYKLPKAEGDKEDASLVLYYFGASQGGTARTSSSDSPSGPGGRPVSISWRMTPTAYMSSRGPAGAPPSRRSGAR